MTTLDRLDAEIIGQLEQGGRTGIAQLASDLGVSRNTIQARMRRLEESGVLRGFRPELDLAAIGLPVQAHISLEVDQRGIPEIIEALDEVPEVLEARTQAGREDLVVLVASSSVSDIQRIAIDLVNIPGVRHTDTTLIVNTVVRYRVWPLLDRLTSAKGWGRSTPPPR
ncbi:Lrp/AsnC family transcriptional regulator [Amycolatopsis endophytica]|uniref:DNA-binding Lrp family transcriptional regulator n=1 Tax=Amycolatopsis endophytica TaxID=860233 RepID=A0A853B9G5_9PSEU|nr:Lrp/AsnC family transcriptional regulator [Amycolatopsis endophytica]NYI91341.1 DNA-binding Lrp family transcriptional regulator [Amycolatopsis endophytica]